MAGTPVSVGGGDDIEIIGSGARSPNELCEHVGTTGSFLVASRSRRSDPSMRLEIYPGIADGEWITGASCNNVARALDWYLASSSYCSNGSVDWTRVQADLDRALPRMGSGAPLFLPYLTGERAPLLDPTCRPAGSACAPHTARRTCSPQWWKGPCSLRNLFDSFAPLGLEIHDRVLVRWIESARYARSACLDLLAAHTHRSGQRPHFLRFGRVGTHQHWRTG